MIEIRDDWIFLLKMTPRHWPIKLNSALKLHWSGGLRISTVNSITNHYNSTFRASSAAVSQARTPASCPLITPSSTEAMSRTGPSRSFSNRKLSSLTTMRPGYSREECRWWYFLVTGWGLGGWSSRSLLFNHETVSISFRYSLSVFCCLERKLKIFVDFMKTILEFGFWNFSLKYLL